MSFKTNYYLIIFTAIFLLSFSCQKVEREQFDEKLETKIEFNPIEEHIGEEDVQIFVHLESNIGQPSAKLYYQIDDVQLDDVWSDPVNLTPLEENLFGYTIPSQDRGTRLNYYLEITTATGTKIYFPRNAPEEESFYTLTFKGEANNFLLAIHIILMVLAILLFIAATYYAFKHLQHQLPVDRALWLSVIGFLLFVVGIVPIGMIVEYQVFGSIFQGWPFGRDVNDTTTLVIFIYWFVSLMMMKNKIFKKEENNLISDKGFASLVVIGTIITLAMYLVPHENVRF